MSQQPSFARLSPKGLWALHLSAGRENLTLLAEPEAGYAPYSLGNRPSPARGANSGARALYR